MKGFLIGLGAVILFAALTDFLSVVGHDTTPH